MSNFLIFIIVAFIVVGALLINRPPKAKAKESTSVPSPEPVHTETQNDEVQTEETPKSDMQSPEVQKAEAPKPVMSIMKESKDEEPQQEQTKEAAPENEMEEPVIESIQTTTTQNETQMKNEKKKPFEMALRDMFAIRGRGLVVTGNVLSGTVKVADQVIISNGEKTVEDIVVGVEYDRTVHDSFTFDGEEKEIGLLLKTAARKDLKGDITGYTVRIAGEPIAEDVEPEEEDEELEPGLYYQDKDNSYYFVGEEEPTKENTLYLTIKQTYFDQIIAGTKKVETRELKETTYKKLLACYPNGDPALNDEVASHDITSDDFLFPWNGGVCPFLPRFELRYLDLAVGYNKERDTARVELSGFSFAPGIGKDGKPMRFNFINDDIVPDPDGQFCFWTIELHIKRVVECHRH